MEWLFRRHFWIVELAFVALAAIILAFCVNKVIEHKLLADLAESARLPTPSVESRNLQRDFEIINERNLFNAKREKAEAIDVPEGNCDRFWESEQTREPIRLVGTLVSSNPLDSLIYIEVPNSRIDAKAYSLRECTPRISQSFSFDDDDLGFGEPPEACNNLAAGEIKRIEDECVYFYNRTTRHCEHLAISAESVCNNQGDYKPRPRETEPSTPIMTPEKEPGDVVRKIGPNLFEIDRSDLDSLLDNVGQILTQARVVGDSVDGKTAIRFVSIQPGSFFEKLGFKVGDVITKINGNEVSSDKGFEFLSKLRTESHYNVEGKRDGNTLNFDYNVRR